MTRRASPAPETFVKSQERERKRVNLFHLARHLSLFVTDMASSKVYLFDEIAKHNKSKDCWLIISGKVYDVTSERCNERF
uniref:Cytochrome b5 heme-binding domain-containing protein n=1 Tax=Salix viminalis TaxID=40686 RepID=A0A6N2K9A1_SALVM